jgi:hypothetical protein
MAPQGLNEGKEAGGEEGKLEEADTLPQTEAKGPFTQPDRDDDSRKCNEGPLKTIEDPIMERRVIIYSIEIRRLFHIFTSRRTLLRGSRVNPVHLPRALSRRNTICRVPVP